MNWSHSDRLCGRQVLLGSGCRKSNLTSRRPAIEDVNRTHCWASSQEKNQKRKLHYMQRTKNTGEGTKPAEIQDRHKGRACNDRNATPKKRQPVEPPLLRGRWNRDVRGQERKSLYLRGLFRLATRIQKLVFRLRIWAKFDLRAPWKTLGIHYFHVNSSRTLPQPQTFDATSTMWDVNRSPAPPQSKTFDVTLNSVRRL